MHRGASCASLNEVDWNCPVCGGMTRRVFAVTPAQIPVRECGACTHRFAEYTLPADHVSAVYADDYFFGGGAGYPDYLREEKILRAHGARYARLLRRYVPQPGRLLDVGGACGFISDGFRQEGWTPLVLEPNARMSAFGRDRLGLATSNGTLDDLPAGEEFDLVTMIQVVAHFPDLRGAFMKAAAVTRANGHWLIETWNCRSLTARLFGSHWHEYNPPSVLHFFSSDSLRRAAADFGFTLIASGHPSKKIMWEHARSLLDHQIRWGWFRAITGALPDDTVFPYPAEDLGWYLFQKSPGAQTSNSVRSSGKNRNTPASR